MSYDEHLISMAGGDGEPDLDAIQARVATSADGNFIERAQRESRLIHQDIPALLAVVRSQQAKLDLIANQCNAAEMLCRMNGTDPEFAIVPAGAIRAALTATEGA